jgi:alkyl hydroperoxide reductase subunit AhpC
MENLSYIPKAVVGKKAPEFTGQIWQNDAIKEVSLKSMEGKWVVLFFYPLDFTFVCPTEICNFSDAYDSFKAISKK